MMLRCLEAADWMANRAAGLSSAQALRLEEHLGECSDCRGELRALDALRSELEASAEPLAAERRALVVERALAEAALQPAPVRPAHRARRAQRAGPLLGAGLAAAAALGLYLANSSTGPDAGVASRSQTRPRGLQPVVVASAAPGVAAAPDTEQAIEAAAEPRPVTVGRARVVLGAHSRMRLRGDASSVTLEHGRLEVELAQAEGAPFEVRTERFGVMVLGARFVTEPEAVQVLSGEVRIVSPRGAPLVERLSAGERWTVGATVAAPAEVATTRARRAARTTSDAAAADALLARARSWLAERRVPEARTAIEGVLRDSASRATRAEALSLAAECSLVERHYEQAVATYLQVAAQHPRLDAGQNALFAAARIRAQQGQAAQARTLLRRYLQRYPTGSFREEAERRLAQLGDTPGP
jgi:ferric-dicitrate binding protein FerR (iron transport regulator)